MGHDSRSWKVTSGILVSPIGETLNEGREVCDSQGTLEYGLEWMRHLLVQECM